MSVGLRNAQELQVYGLASALSKAADLEHLLESTPLKIALWNADFTNRFSSMSYAKDYGYSPQELRGKRVEEILPSDIFEGAMRRIKLALAGSPQEFERTYKTPQGVFLVEKIFYIPDTRTQPSGLMVFSVDVTEQRNAEQNSKDLANRFRDYYRDTPAALHVLDQVGNLRQVSKRWCDLMEYDAQDVIGRHITEFMTPASKALLSGSLSSFFNTGGTQIDLDYQLIKASGDVIEVQLSAYARIDTMGHFVEGLAIFHDVTEQRIAQRGLQESQRMLARAEQIGETGAWAFDIESKTLRWSKQTFQIYELDNLDQLTLEDALAFYPMESRKSAKDRLHLAITQGTSYVIEVPLVTAKGNHRWVEVSGSPGFKDGRVVRIDGCIRDITERKEAQLKLLESTVRYRRIYEKTPGMLHSMDRNGHLIAVSDSWLDQLGYERHQVIGHKSTDFLTEASRVKARDLIIPQFFKDGFVKNIDYQFVKKSGEIIDVLLSAVSEYDDTGEFQRSLAVSIDVTEKKKFEVELQEQHELLRVTLNSIGDAVITTNKDGQIEWMNPIACNLTGWSMEDAQGKSIENIFRLVNEFTMKPIESPVEHVLHTNASTTLPELTSLICKDGRIRGISDSVSPIKDASGKLVGAVVVFHDVSEQRKLSQEVTYRATRDALTGLMNRSEFDAQLARVFAEVKLGSPDGVLMFIDLDQFKLVNDACGHAAGDFLLKEVSTIMSDSVRNSDTLARLGGDEFAVIMEDCQLAHARRVAQKICDQLEVYRFIHSGHGYRTGASIGLVPIDSHWINTDGLLQAADSACYAAKEEGRNRVHEWIDSDEMIHLRNGEMQWASRLNRAIEENSFVLYGQRISPINKMHNEGIHLEILIRLIDSDGKLISPGVFIGAAERFSQITRIDQWVLGKTAQWIRQHSEKLELVAVNISGQSLSDKKFHSFALAMIDGLGDDAAKLCFEVTETAAINNIGTARKFLTDIRNKGALVALDDFGAGATSFGYLKGLPVDFLKIDGQFVKDILIDPLDRAAVRCFQEVAQICKIRTIAEFVESSQILEELSTIGIDFAQGYHLHMPEPLNNIL